MRVLIITCAGMSTRFSKSVGYNCLKCIYSDKDIKQSILYKSIMNNVSYFDKIIIVGGFKFDDLNKFINKYFEDLKEKIILVDNKMYAKYGSGYSFWLGLKQAFDYETSEIVFMEGDLYINEKEFKIDHSAENFMIDTFSLYHPFVNFFYFCVVLLFSMFNQHPVFLGISYAGAFSYAVLLNGWKKTAKQSFLFTLPCLTIIALMNPLFNHYGVTMLYYVESSGNWITLESLVYGIVLGAVMFVVIQWFSCYNEIMTTDKFIYFLIYSLNY